MEPEELKRVLIKAGAVIFAIIVIIVIIARIFFTKPTQPAEAPTPPVKSGELISSQEKSFDDYKYASIIPVQPGSEEKSASQIEAEDDYFAQHELTFNFYRLVVRKEPTDVTQAIAEQFLLEMFDQNKSDLCALDWQVTIPKDLTQGRISAVSKQGLNVCQ